MPIKKLSVGVLLSFGVSVIVFYLSKLELLIQFGLSPLILAIILGIIIGNSIYPLLAPTCNSGVDFVKTKILRLGIILYGFNLTFQQIFMVGFNSFIIDVIVIISTFSLTMFIGCKLLKIHPYSVCLIGAGASICGAAAVMATSSLFRADSRRVSVAVATVVIWGTVGIFFYPWLDNFLINLGYTFTDTNFGIYIGSTVHEVAQVVVAGNTIGQEAANSAVIAKMVRVMLLAPFLLVLAYAISKRKAKREPSVANKQAIYIPWFAILFIVVAIFNSFNFLPKIAVQYLQQIDLFLLTMAMAALGFTTHIKAIKQAGIKPFILSGIIFVWLVFGGGMLNITINFLFA